MNERHAAVPRVSDGAASVILDQRHTPVLLATWIGAPTLSLVAKAQAWLDSAYAKARADGSTGLVIISDATLVQVPSAEVRRSVAELRHDSDLMLKVIAVVPAHNTMVRGVINGIAWILGDNRRYTVASSIEHALDLTAQAFEQRGLAVPSQFAQLRSAIAGSQGPVRTATAAQDGRPP